jgi:tetratricopeptide (TPR) repeat protein
MQVRRDYSQPLFGKRRRGGTSLTFILVVVLFLVGFFIFFTTNFSRLQLAAMDAVGMAPTATPYASNWAVQGMNLFYEGDLDEAIAAFEEAVRQQPNNIDYLYEYGSLLMEDDRVADAMVVAEQAINVASDDPRGYALKARGLMFDDPPQAIQVAIQGVDRDPDFAPLYAAQGVAYTFLGRWQEGLRMATRAVELDPNNIFVQMSYQWPATYRGDYRGAIEAIERAIGLNPNLPTPYFYLAALYNLPQVNEKEMAIATYNRVLEMAITIEDEAKANLRLCQVFAGVDQARFDLAQPYCDQAIRIDPEYGDAYAQRGQMQYVRRNYEGAIESFNSCLQYGSDKIECYYLRGFAHYRLGQCDDAWEIVNESRFLAVEQNLPTIVQNIDFVLDGITRNCSGYSDRTVPTPPPAPTAPPTPIGGFG